MRLEREWRIRFLEEPGVMQEFCCTCDTLDRVKIKKALILLGITPPALRELTTDDLKILYNSLCKEN